MIVVQSTSGKWPQSLILYFHLQRIEASFTVLQDSQTHVDSRWNFAFMIYTAEIIVF